ncbi:MAG: ABC transporter ATP-binding protein [Desulfarculaceae bacterium]|jgi:oligopeptide/dipeptide ABC transporter ATP-binding protein
MALIEVNDLKTYFHTLDGVVRAVDGVTFRIQREQTLGVVGESGCGKSVTSQAIMGLIDSPPGKIESGQILFERENEMVDLAKLNPKSPEMRSIRGNEIAMIFQEPMTSLNPAFTIGNQILEAIQLHQHLSSAEEMEKAVEMLDAVGIPSARQRLDEFPHQLSGGMRQRAMIAMALCCNPRLLIADEPTTALDVTIQAQVLDLMNKLKREYHTAIMFITHDLGVIASMADHVIVMYLGKIVEDAPVRDIFHSPRHPYTQGLMKSIPSLTRMNSERLEPIKGVVPDPYDVPQGCGFGPRCPHRMDICKEKIPPLKEVAPNHLSACWL